MRDRRNALRILPAVIVAFVNLSATRIGNGNNPALSVNRIPSPSTVNYVTYHYDNMRTGWNPHETILTPALVRSRRFGIIATISLDGRVYAQALYVSNVRIPNFGYHNLAIVATEHDTVYAIDADTGTIVWKRSFLGSGVSPLPGTTILTRDPSNECINPEIGITSTPAIDLARRRIYLVTGTSEQGAPHYRLRAITLARGDDDARAADIVGSVRLSDGSALAFDPAYELNRPGILLTHANKDVYVAFGSSCDRNPPRQTLGHGWLFGYRASTLQSNGLVWNSQTNNQQKAFPPYSSLVNGSIWQAGFGVASDMDGNLYFATGNGEWDGNNNYGDSVIKFSAASLAPTDYFTPAGWAGESYADLDLGSGGVMVIPDQPNAPRHLAIAGGKSGVTYLLNRDNLGRKLGGGNDVAAAQSGAGALSAILTATSGFDALLGGPAYFVGSDGKPNIVIASHSSDADQISPTGYPAGWLTIVGIARKTHTFAELFTKWRTLISPVDAGTIPVVSSNGTKANTAIIWITSRPANTATTQLRLQAYNPANRALLADVPLPGLWNTARPLSGHPFLTPTVANGHVFIAGNGTLSILGPTRPH
jgi:hypothetical protein